MTLFFLSYSILYYLDGPSFTSQTPQFCKPTEASNEMTRTLMCTVSNGMNFTLQCQHDANPEASLRITFNDTDIASAGTNVVVQNETIVIRSFISSRNTGRYQCVASNMVGRETRSASLTYVLSKCSTQLFCGGGA